MIRVFTVLLIVVVFSNLDRIRNALEKNDFDKSLKLIQKGLEKEPDNPGLNYYKAVLYNTKIFKGYHLDSARIYIKKSRDGYNSSSEELRESLADDAITKHIIDSLDALIQLQFYRLAIENISLPKIDSFKLLYPGSAYESILEFKKDSILFVKATENNTVEAFQTYIKQRPTSIYIDEADSIMNYLAYKKVNNNDLKRYYEFIRDFPESPYRKDAEKFILKNSTRINSREEYMDFLEIARTPIWRKLACDILFYKNPTDRAILQHHPEKDSILKVLNHPYGVFPIVQERKVGFVDLNGSMVIKPYWDAIGMQSKCELITSDWIYVVKNNTGFIINKSGELILSQVSEFRDLGSGLAMVKKQNSWFLFHKNGYPLLDEPISDAEVIDGKWVKVKKENQWGLISFLGYLIARFEYDNIHKKGPLWAFEKEGLIALETTEYIHNNLDEKGLVLEFKFEEIELVGEKYILGFKRDMECLLDTSLNFLIPWGKYEINPDDQSWYTRSEKGYKLIINNYIEDKFYDYLESNDGWVAVKTEIDWILIPKRKKLPTRGYDSLKLINDFAAVTMVGGDEQILFLNKKTINKTEASTIKTFQLKDDFFLLKDNGFQTLYDSAGNEVFRKKLDEARFINDSLLIVEYRGKQGIISLNGEYLIELQYDFLEPDNDLILILDDGKIGTYDLQNQLLIPPEYEQKISRMGKYYRTAIDSRVGILDSLGDASIVPFDYEDIVMWNDTSFLVRNGDRFDILATDGEILQDGLESMGKIYSKENDEIWMFLKDGKYGLISNTKGMILKPEFTDIINIGDNTTPVFFADQNLYTAKYHVVSYINKEGELIVSQAYKREDYDLILCDE